MDASSQEKENANPTVHQVSTAIGSSAQRVQSYRRRELRGGTSAVDSFPDGTPSAGELAWRQIQRFNLDAEPLDNGDSPANGRTSILRSRGSRPLLSFTAEDPKEVTDEEVAAPAFATLNFAPTSYRSASERAVHLALYDVANDERADDPTHDDVGLLRAAGFVLPSSTAEASLLPRMPPSVVPFEPKDDAFLTPSTAPAACDPRRDLFDSAEVFDMIRNIQDPEHPLTLQQLNVVNIDHVVVVDTAHDQKSGERTEPANSARPDDRAAGNSDGQQGGQNREDEGATQVAMNWREPPPVSHPTVDVRFTPTIPHCSMATLIGLCIRVKLLRSLPSRFKVTVRINPGTHASEHAINKQLDDKERVRAALENSNLRSVVDKCIAAQELQKKG